MFNASVGGIEGSIAECDFSALDVNVGPIQADTLRRVGFGANFRAQK
jgi:hypothetical protein